MTDLIIRPTGVGNTTDLTPYGETNNWECVDEVSSDGDTTRVYPSGLPNTEYDTYQMANHTSETEPITNVRVHVVAEKITTGGGANDATRTVLRSGGTDYYGSSETLTGDTYIEYYTDYSQNPADTEDWEWADIDALEAGIELYGHGTVSPRGTQVFVTITYIPPGKSDRDISVDVEVQGYSDRDISVDVLIAGISDRSVSVDIDYDENPQVDFLRYDLTNTRWTDGSYGGELNPMTNHIVKLIKEEKINTLSTIKLTIKDYDESWGLSLLSTICVATGFAWAGTPGNSASSLGKFYFQGRITKMVKKNVNQEGEYDLEIQAVHSLHALSVRYEYYVISTFRVVWGGDEIQCTPAYHLKKMLETVTYYDENGTSGTIPYYVKTCPNYIYHKEWSDKNQLQVFLDICDYSTNIFYCHNDAFYFEPVKPALMSAYFEDTLNQQNWRDISYDSTFKLEETLALTQNTYDIGSSVTLGDTMQVQIRNTSPYSQLAFGAAMWIGDIDAGTATGDMSLYTMTDGRTTGTVVSNTLRQMASFTPSDPIQLMRNYVDWNSGGTTLTSGNVYLVRYYFFGISGATLCHVGTLYPARKGNFTMIETSAGWIWRSGFELPCYFWANDQIRMFNPQIPPRYIMNRTGYQRDAWIQQGWNPDLQNYGLSGIGMDGLYNWSDSGYEHLFILPKDLNYVSGDQASEIPNVNAGLDDDENLDKWYNNLKSFNVQLTLTKPLDESLDDGAYFGVRIANHWNGNGLDDGCEVRYQRFGSRYFVMYYLYNNNVSDFKGSYEINIGSTTITELNILFDFSESNIRAVGMAKSSDEPNYVDFGISSRAGTGLNIVGRDWDENIGFRSIVINEVEQRDTLLDEDLITKIKYNYHDLFSQIVVIGEKTAESGTKVPVGRYPPLAPLGVGGVKVIKAKVNTDAAANALAKHSYEEMITWKLIDHTWTATLVASLDFEIYDFLTTEPHTRMRVNKQVEVEGEFYYINEIMYDFSLPQKVKVKCGYPQTDFYEYLNIVKKEEEERAEQEVINAPIAVEFEISDSVDADDMIDNPPTRRGGPGGGDPDLHYPGTYVIK